MCVGEQLYIMTKEKKNSIVAKLQACGNSNRLLCNVIDPRPAKLERDFFIIYISLFQ